MRNAVHTWIVAAAAVAAAAEPTVAAVSGLQQVAGGLLLPSFATHAPGNPDRLFVTGLSGNITIIDLTTSSVIGTFLDIADTDNTSEGGLLGLAFHPHYSSPHLSHPGRGKFYVYVTVDNNRDTSLGVMSPFSSHIREYTVDPTNPNVALPDSKREILSFVQPQANHNAGWIGFNPALNPGQPQYLYISSGDGGGTFDDDPGHTPEIGNAQDTTNNLLGKMLRIDVNGDDFPSDDNRNYSVPPTNPFVEGVGIPEDDVGDDEIWSYGLRNPYRDSFDRRTGDLWIADVGQNQREEIDFQPAASAGGENYGWRKREGFAQTLNVGGPLIEEYTQPIYDYTRGGGNPGPLQGEAVIGGYRYRGPDPALQGLYFFGDSDFVRVWTLDPPEPVAAGATVTNINAQLGPSLASVVRIVSFAEDSKGNLYIVDIGTGGYTGSLHRIITDNLIPGDYNADGFVQSLDFDEWFKAFGNSGTHLASDGNYDGVVDAADYIVWRKNDGASVHELAGASDASAPEPMPAFTVIQIGCVSLCARARRRKAPVDRTCLESRVKQACNSALSVPIHATL